MIVGRWPETESRDRATRAPHAVTNVRLANLAMRSTVWDLAQSNVLTVICVFGCGARLDIRTNGWDGETPRYNATPGPASSM